MTWLEAALDIGHRLRAQVRLGPQGRHWLGDDLAGDDPALARVVQGDTGSGLYSGAAGIGWFLAQLGHCVGDSGLRHCGVEAMLGALAHNRAALAADSLSLYGGASGVALSAWQVGQRLHEPVLQKSALSLARAVARCMVVGQMPKEVDLIGGVAGIGIVLAALQRQSPQAGLAKACRVAGERLLETAAVDWTGAHWSDPHSSQGAAGLCGLAHGVSGIAWALFELADVTGEPRFEALAREAMRYERSWFSPVDCSWPDLRGDAQVVGWPSTMTAWCHGGIGIAALRLQRYARQGDLGALAEAGAALHSLRAPVAAARRALEAGGTFDASLCHGLGGAVELFTLAHQATGLADHGRAAQHAGRLCLALRRANAGRWTNGVPGATAVPGLMVGDAGIGAMLLRLHQPGAIGSPLRPGLD